MRTLGAAAAALFFVLILAQAACGPAGDGPGARTAASLPLRDGLYPVLWESANADSAALRAPGHVVLPYDRLYTGSKEREPRTWLAIDTTSTVPLLLEGEPEARADETGRALLSVTLAHEQVGPLESFTRDHLGRPVAILLDGEVVTMHKVRTVIQDGRMQITRCDSNTCEVLRSRLLD
ncbi:MAG: hypothetical protein ACE15D_06100 [Candidatus Eisenbacteria bacterium]|nr:hypothetical protein [Candidatus Eisenbacteria bacterium]